MSKGKVVIADYYYENLDTETATIRGYGADLYSYHCTTEDEVIEIAADADVLIVQFAPITRRVIEHLKKCKLIVRYAVGVDIIDLVAASEKGIYVANVPDYGVDEVSNHTVTMLMALSRKIVQACQSVQDGNWHYSFVKPLHRMSGRTLGLIGFGRIAQLVAFKMLHFGLDIVVYDPYVSESFVKQHCVKKVDLETLLRTSDYISVHAPLTDKTYHLIDREAVDQMKEGVIFISTSRGQLVSEEALLHGLDQGIIAAAGLDVLEKEPVDMSNSLLNRDNVLITPHLAWYSQESIAELQQMVADETVRVLDGNAPLNLVNKHLLLKNVARRGD